MIRRTLTRMHSDHTFFRMRTRMCSDVRMRVFQDLASLRHNSPRQSPKNDPFQNRVPAPRPPKKKFAPPKKKSYFINAPRRRSPKKKKTQYHDRVPWRWFACPIDIKVWFFVNTPPN
ncbi:hypothetical protein O6H91_04G016900 [Diphasiastrum complanatum]|uniref:Uncharacterized protein n=1 Tax=Diphasiastrum complanatum TaxID=34168 RepID=A0ACC2DUH3_DIPCM|nr:hypothetical protein O6H91_04G016900 [Diphasiastrum complanatum]